jgi:signal transduction histidine kinase
LPLPGGMERRSPTVPERSGQARDLARELARSEARFRDVIERNADAIIVVDRGGIVRFANQAAASMFRSTREGLLGTSFGFPLVLGDATELDLPADGDSRVVEMRVVESEWEGEEACIASLRDITERKRGEEGARRLIREQAARGAAELAARRFRFLAEAGTLLSSSLDFTETLATLARLCVQEMADWAVVYLLDSEGRVRRLEVAHRDPEMAELVREIRDDPIDPEGPHPVLEVLRTGEPVLAARVGDEGLRAVAQDSRHLELLRKLGVASFMLVPLVARDRALGALALVSANPERAFDDEDLAYASDLALRAALALDNARLFHEARAADEAKSHLLAVISHDLRTPLSSIMGHAELLSMGIPEPLGEKVLERVERIRTSSNHLLYLIDELLSFARVEGGREELRLREVDACAMAREVATVMEPLAVARGLALHVEERVSGAVLHTDPDRLRQVLLNLVGNGVKYTERGEVRLLVEPGNEGGVVYRVRDTGIGIREEDLERIFEPFWQAQRGERTPERGTGLGLSVVRRLCDLLGGRITVESQPGKGSTFTLSLPPASQEGT